jgi:ribonuclease VapC
VRVLDASALLALLFGEPGADEVHATLGDAVMSAANLAEVAAKYGDLGLSPADLVSQVPRLGIVLEPVTAEDAVLQADVRARDALGNDGRPHLSLGDRLCLALALRLDLPVLTADRAWDRLDLPVSVTQLR